MCVYCMRVCVCALGYERVFIVYVRREKERERVCVCVCHSYTCIYTQPHSPHTYIHTDIQTYIHIYIHTYIQTYIPSNKALSCDLINES